MQFRRRPFCFRSCGIGGPIARIGPGQLRVRLTRADRQRDRERRAAVGVVGGPDFAAVAFDDGATDRQPDPQAVAFARDEGVEDGLETFQGDSCATVLQLDQDV